jgi:hypothetical protein
VPCWTDCGKLFERVVIALTRVLISEIVDIFAETRSVDLKGMRGSKNLIEKKK